MKTWTIANQKGGVGKTTTVISLAGVLAARGARCLLVDLDPHASLTQYFRLEEADAGGGVYALFDPDTAPAVRVLPTAVDNISVLPGSVALATLDRQAQPGAGRGRVLAEALKRWETAYDYALLDCPPVLGMLMVNALAACERVILPTQAEFLALKGLDCMLRTLGMVERAQGRALEYTIVPTLYDRRTRAGHEALRDLERKYSAQLWDEAIPEDTQFRDASRQALPLEQWQPEARGALAYRRLLDRLLAVPEAQPC